jgi:hypothetical protein
MAKTPKGKAKSRGNALKHGCRSIKLIFEGEGRAQFEQLETMWRAEFPALSEAMSRVLTRLVTADFQSQWNEQRLLETEAALEEKDPSAWSEDDHKQLQRFQRYHTTAERQFQRVWNLLKPFRKETAAAPERRHVAQAAAPAAAVKTELVIPKPILLTQTVVVKIEDGKTVTWTHPTTEMLLAQAALADEKTTVCRVFEFPHGVPAEYEWVGAARHQKMSLPVWLKMAKRERASGSEHLGECDDAA